MKLASIAVSAHLAVLSCLGVAWANDPGIDWCHVPDSLMRADSSLPRVAEAVANRQSIKIVVLGTASSAGVGVSVPYQAYPERLREELSRHLSRAPVTLVNLSQRGWTAIDMFSALDAKVIPLKPTLVIWQTGSVEAVRGLDVNQMGDALSAGIEKLRANSADVILVGPQYGPQPAALINFAPYAEYMQWIAGSLDVNFFNRFGIMRYWFEEKFVTIDETDRASQRMGANQVHECVAVRLADLILRAAHLDEPSAR